MIETTKENVPFFGKTGGEGEATGEINDSQIEPIKNNAAIFSLEKSRAN